MKRIISILVILQAVLMTAAARDVDSLWTQAVNDYTQERYEEALSAFSAVEEAGY